MLVKRITHLKYTYNDVIKAICNTILNLQIPEYLFLLLTYRDNLSKHF